MRRDRGGQTVEQDPLMCTSEVTPPLAEVSGFVECFQSIGNLVIHTGLHIPGLRDGRQGAPTAEDEVGGKGEKLWVRGRGA